MKVLILNGSPKSNGNTAIAIEEMIKTFTEEDVQTERVLARNMSFLIKSIALGKEKYGLPEKEEHRWTHFIDN